MRESKIKESCSFIRTDDANFGKNMINESRVISLRLIMKIKEISC